MYFLEPIKEEVNLLVECLKAWDKEENTEQRPFIRYVFQRTVEDINRRGFNIQIEDMIEFLRNNFMEE